MTMNYTPAPAPYTPAPGTLPSQSQPYTLDPVTLERMIKPGYTPLVGTLETGLPFKSAAPSKTPVTTAEEEPTGNLQFDAWLEAYGLTNAWGTGGAAIQKDIWTAYQTYLTGAAPVEEGAAGVGAAAPLFSPEEERLMKDLENAVSVGQLDEEQAWKVIENYWTEETARENRAETATTRGQEILRGTFPGTTFPGTGPGGIGDILAKKWGGPNLMPALQGIPTEQAMGVFGQAQQQVGLPAQLEPLQPPQFQLPNWGAFMQNMPTFGGGNKYLDELLKEGRTTAPTLG